MSSRKLPNPMSDLENAFMLATQILGIAGPIAKAFSGARGGDGDDDDDSSVPSPSPRPSPRPSQVSRAQRATEATAEIVCAVCDNTKLVGMRGNQVACPACSVSPSVSTPKKCDTCGGCGRVGMVGHTVKCPVC